jgi:hypothetical protein
MSRLLQVHAFVVPLLQHYFYIPYEVYHLTHQTTSFDMRVLQKKKLTTETNNDIS